MVSEQLQVTAEIVEKWKNLEAAQKAIKHLDANIAAQEARNEKRMKELAKMSSSYPSDLEANVLLFCNIRSKRRLKFSFAYRSRAAIPKIKAWHLHFTSLVHGRSFLIKPVLYMVSDESALCCTVVHGPVQTEVYRFITRKCLIDCLIFA